MKKKKRDTNRDIQKNGKKKKQFKRESRSTIQNERVTSENKFVQIILDQCINLIILLLINLIKNTNIYLFQISYLIYFIQNPHIPPHPRDDAFVLIESTFLSFIYISSSKPLPSLCSSHLPHPHPNTTTWLKIMISNAKASGLYDAGSPSGVGNSLWFVLAGPTRGEGFCLLECLRRSD